LLGLAALCRFVQGLFNQEHEGVERGVGTSPLVVTTEFLQNTNRVVHSRFETSSKSIQVEVHSWTRWSGGPVTKQVCAWVSAWQ
jgi:hypothetical protein